MIAEANIDTKAQDNVGKVPLDMTATTPGYQKELRDFIAEHDLAQKKKLEAAENSNDTVCTIAYLNSLLFVEALRN